MSSSESDSEFDVRKEGDDEDEKDDVDDGPPAWMIGKKAVASSSSHAAPSAPTSAPLFDATKILEAAAAKQGAAPACAAVTPNEAPMETSTASAPPAVAAATSAGAKEKPKKDDMSMDKFFGALLNEVNGIKSQKRQKMEEQFASPEEMVERLVGKEFKSAFEVLQISPDATEGEITKMYRKVSMMVHPDKCKHERAHDAFQVVSKAYTDLKDPVYKEKYKDVIEQAKKRVNEAREKENLARKKSGEEQLPMDGPDFDQAVVLECDNMLNVTEKEATYADKVRQANESRMNGLQGERKKRDRKEMTDKKKWEVNRDKRVAGWQIFQQNVSNKKFKNLSSGKIGVLGAADRFHMREERTELEEEQKKHCTKEDGTKIEGRQAGVDYSHKTNWR